MKKQHDKFVQGCVTNGMTKKNAENMWILFEPFAGYGFGKAHAACYATIAFRTAYLKAHFPVEFMTALLTAESRGTTGPVKNEKIAQAVAECKRLNIPVLPPDINKSDSEFSIEGKKSIRFGLSAIKNVGAAAIESILSARGKGDFISLLDFSQRVDLSKVNKKTMESLIKAGALDRFGKRSSLLIALPEITERSHRMHKQDEEGQTSLFEDDPPKTLSESMYHDGSIDDFSKEEKLAFEKEFLGFYLTSHPQMQNLLNIKSEITHEFEMLLEEKEGSRVKIGGIIEASRRTFTKKTGSEMAFVVVGDEKGMAVECVVFPKVFDKYKSFLAKDTVVVIEGHVDTKNDKPTIIAERIFFFSS